MFTIRIARYAGGGATRARLLRRLLSVMATLLTISPTDLIAQPLATTTTLLSTAKKPVVAIVADSAGTEITDFVIPHATLVQSGVAEVVTVASNSATIPLLPSTLLVKSDLTFAGFDAAFPSGATYVIVPAMVNRNNAAMRSWLRAQAARGATIVSICEGAWIVADAGLFDGQRATSHWHALDGLAKKYPRTTWVRDARYVIGDHRISTTGVTASLPVSLYLIEQMGGRALAESVAQRVGELSWSTSHRTSDFAISKRMYAQGVWDYVAWWRHDLIAVPASDGVDEIALAFTMDMIPRTIRGRAFVKLDSGSSVRARQGLLFFVDRPAESVSSVKMIPLPKRDEPPTAAIASTIAQLVAWYGPGARELIAMGMEIPRSALR